MGSVSFNNLTDEELAVSFQNGNLSAFSVIVARFAPIVKNRASGYFGSELEPDDLAQEGMIGLLNAANSFSDNKGASFKTYAILCIDRSITSAVRKVLASNRIHDTDKVYMDQILDESEIACDGPEEILFSNNNAEFLVQQFQSILSKLEYNVFLLYIGGCDYSEIAKRLNIKTKSVDNAITRIKSKIKDVKI